VGGEGQTCVGNGSYEAPRLGVNCRNWWELVDGDVFVKVESADNIEECLAACDARSDCTAVSDFFGRRASYGCTVSSEPCEPVEPIWAAEDAGVEYVKVCPVSGACRMDPLGWGVRCDADGGNGSRVAGATSFADCAAICLGDPSCVSADDHSYLNDFVGCFLNVAPCDRMVETYDEGTLYRKICD
jgi:hypothetical protein